MKYALRCLALLFVLVSQVCADFVRTDPATLVPSILAYSTHVERVDDGRTIPVPQNGNPLKIACDLSEPGDVIGLLCRVRALQIGDGKNQYYADSVNKPGGLHHVAIVGLNSDAEIVGTTMLYQRKGFAPNEHLGFFSLTMTGTTGYAMWQTCQGDPPIYGLEAEDVTFVPTYNQYSAVRFHGPAQFSIRNCDFKSGMKEHGVYAENPSEDSEVDSCRFERTGRCAAQVVNRIESGPPQKGDIRIARNKIKQPLDAFAITVAGQSDPNGQVLIAYNEIEIDGNVAGSTAGGIMVYREGPNVSLPIPKLGAWPVGSTGNEGYSATNLPPSAWPCINSVVLRHNEVIGNNLKKQLVAVGSCRTLRLENGYFESNNKNALDINHQGAVVTTVLTFGSSYRGWKLCKGGKINSLATGKPVALTAVQIDSLQEIADPSTK